MSRWPELERPGSEIFAYAEKVGGAPHRRFLDSYEENTGGVQMPPLPGPLAHSNLIPSGGPISPNLPSSIFILSLSNAAKHSGHAW